MSHIEYSVYDITSGRIVCIGFTEDLALVHLEDGQAIINGIYDRHTQWVVNGQVVGRPQAELDQEELDAAWGNLRAMRKQKLSACDWTQVPDAPVDQAAWAVYRQQLRDLPSNTTDPRNPAWPSPPA